MFKNKNAYLFHILILYFSTAIKTYHICQLKSISYGLMKYLWKYWLKIIKVHVCALSSANADLVLKKSIRLRAPIAITVPSPTRPAPLPLIWVWPSARYRIVTKPLADNRESSGAIRRGISRVVGAPMVTTAHSLASRVGDVPAGNAWIARPSAAKTFG